MPKSNLTSHFPFLTSHIPCLVAILIATCLFAGTAHSRGIMVTDDLWIRAVIQTNEKGPVDAVWEHGGEGRTDAGDRVIWGYFHASPDDVSWGSPQNPDLFVKIWFDRAGRVDVNFFHVSVPDIEVYSDYPYDGTPDQHGTTTLTRRYIRQYYENGQSGIAENDEDGNPVGHDLPDGNPFGYVPVNAMKIGALIRTLEKGPIEARWYYGGRDTTIDGHTVVWGYFYADPEDVTWGSMNNPDLFTKIWFDASGRVDVNFFHVSVPDIDVCSDLPDEDPYDQKGTTLLSNRYIRHEYQHAPHEMELVLQTLVDQVVSVSDEIHNSVLLVDAPDFEWKGASGMADPDEGIRMLPDDLFRVAGIGKMMCATVAMTLVEEGKIDLDEMIRHYLPASITDGLHEYQGQSYGQTITVRQLLNHTSGLPDCFTDGDANHNGMADFVEMMFMNPDKSWDPEDVIEYGKAHLTPFFPPGEGYHYSGNNYQLMGLIVEAVTRTSLDQVCRDRLFDPLEMGHTYMEFQETPRQSIPGRSLSHIHAQEADYTDMASYSAHWPGIVSTVGDLNRFVRAFARNEIFSDPLTKDRMFEWVGLGMGIHYGLGVDRMVFDEFGIPGLSGLGEIWGHSGLGNAFMYYWPQEDVSFCGTLNQTFIKDEEGLAWFFENILPIMLEMKQDAGQTWTQAFELLHEQISSEYAFTKWKGIDWDALYEKFRPRVAEAQAGEDETAYYLALREYAYAIPDGHVSLEAYTDEGRTRAATTAREQIGGGYGLAVIHLDDARVVAHIVPEGGSAFQAGMRVGADILEWNGESIRTALDNVPVLWAGGSSPSTHEVRQIEQCRFLGRAPIGTQASATFRNPGGFMASSTVTLTAEDDDYETYILTNYRPTSKELGIPVRYEILSEGYGYLRLTDEPGAEDSDNDAFMAQYRNAIRTFVDREVPGVVLDLRRNNGTDDETAATLAGFFHTETAHYQTTESYNALSGEYEVTETLEIMPQSPHYDGPVVVMVGPGCARAGEGLARAIQKLPQGQVVSFYASNGSTGVAGGTVLMPGGFMLAYPIGRSLDENGGVQIDSDANGNGGVIPDIRVPLTEATIHTAFVEGKDVELEFVTDLLQNNGL